MGDKIHNAKTCSDYEITISKLRNRVKECEQVIKNYMTPMTQKKPEPIQIEPAEIRKAREDLKLANDRIQQYTNILKDLKQLPRSTRRRLTRDLLEEYFCRRELPRTCK